MQQLKENTRDEKKPIVNKKECPPCTGVPTCPDTVKTTKCQEKQDYSPPIQMEYPPCPSYEDKVSALFIMYIFCLLKSNNFDNYIKKKKQVILCMLRSIF